MKCLPRGVTPRKKYFAGFAKRISYVILAQSHDCQQAFIKRRIQGKPFW